MQIITKRDQIIEELERVIERGKSSDNQVGELENLRKENEQKINLMQVEIKELQEEILTLENYRTDFKNELLQKNIEYNLEIQSLEDEQEKLRRNLAEQIRSKENQLERSHEEKQKIYLEKRQLEDKLSKIDQLDYEEIVGQLKLDLKQTRLLLKYAQKEIEERKNESNNTKLIKQLKNHIEERKKERKKERKRERERESASH